MAGLLKSGRGVNITGSVVINNEVKIPAKAEEPIKEELDHIVHTDKKADIPADTAKEYERIRQFYISEGEKALASAKQAADAIIEKTRKESQKHTEEAEIKARELFEKSKNDGFLQGQEEGYKKGVLKCKEMLLELKSISDRINSEKEQLFNDYEIELFDTVFEIAQKVTMDSLLDKDRDVIKRIIKESGKKFRNSDYIKISLSQADITEEMTTDLDFFKNLVVNVKHVEVEVLKDAAPGTVILDDGSEITDASISTQLKMIEELGAGKYRKAPSPKVQKKLEEAEKAQKALLEKDNETSDLS